MTVRRVKSRQELFLEQFVQQATQQAAATDGMTPEQRTEWEALLERKATQQRHVLWTHWLRVSSWTVRQAACLVLARNPDRPFRGIERHSRATKDHVNTAVARLEAFADERLELKSRRGIRPRRYAPHELITLMLAEGWGFAGELAALAEFMGIGSSSHVRAKIPEGSGRKRTRPNRRAELVVAVARQLLGVSSEDSRSVLELPYSTSEFREKLNELCPPGDRGLLSCSDDTLKAARLDRSRRADLPKVQLRRGPPPR
jgi:hypothetical protein